MKIDIDIGFHGNTFGKILTTRFFKITMEEGLWAAMISSGCNSSPNVSDWSPYSGLIAFGTHQNVALYDPFNVNCNGIFETLIGHTGSVTAVRFFWGFCDKKEGILSGSLDSTVKIWKKKTNCFECVYTILEHKSPIHVLATLASYIIIGATDGMISIWKINDLDTYELFIDNIQVINSVNMYPLSMSLHVLPNTTNMLFTVGGSSNLIDVYVSSIVNGKYVFTYISSLDGHSDWVRSLDITVEQKTGDLLLASASQDKYVRIWRIAHIFVCEKGETASNELKNNDNEIDILLTNKIFNFLVEEENIIHKYSVSFDALLMGHDDWIFTCSWHPNGELKLLTASADTSLIIWHPDNHSGIWVSLCRVGELSLSKGSSTATGSFGGFFGGLWGPNEELFTEARRIRRICMGEEGFKEYRKLITTGIGCLEAVLQRESIPVKVEIRTRLRMAEVIFEETDNLGEAEEVLSKGVILAQRVRGKWGTEDEICDAALASTYSYGNIGKSRENHDQKMYSGGGRTGGHRLGLYFCFLEFDVLSRAEWRDTERGGRMSILSKIQQVSRNQGDQMVYIVACLLEIYVRIEQEEYYLARQRLDHISEIQAGFKDISTLNLVKMIFSVFLNIMQGYREAAVHELKDLHSALDALAQYDMDHSPQNAIEISLGSEGCSKLAIHWFNRQQLFVYGHLLAGICYLPDYTSSKAQVFLNEGLEMLKCKHFACIPYTCQLLTRFKDNLVYDSFLSNNLRTNRNLDWFSITRELCLIYYCFALMLRSDFDKAFEVGIPFSFFVYLFIRSVYSRSRQVFIVFNNNTKALYMLLKGTYAQFTDQLDIALKAYDSIPASIQAICLLGNLNSALIFQGNKLHDKRRAHEILNHIKPLCQSSNFTQLRFAWDLVNGSMGDDVLHSKNCLLSVVSTFEKHANNQLRVIASIVLCYYFIIHSETEQAEKILISAYLLSRNAGSNLWAFMSGELLEELMRKKNRKIKAEKQLGLNLKHKECILDLFNHAHVITID
ncbi:unnamed protein product [Pneumocystis jirovecii]|uniref:Elongator complex protein 2 n=1 Tax=Pneumocystis jirovecii TaxID=42068 RepID=L0PIM6_PNEJI|nr:unnamed protein product [Pneumocystis jirovecii]